MVHTFRRSPTDSSKLSFPTLAETIAVMSLVGVLVIVTLASATCFAQDQPSLDQPKQDQSQLPSAPEPQPATPAAPARPATVVVPAGTRLPLALIAPISSRTVHRGDNIQTQITAPIPAGDRVAIPPGTFIQGTVEKLTRNGSRAEIMLQSASILFPDGYVAHVAGPIHVESDEGTAWNNPGGGTRAAVVLAPALGLGLGAAIGSAAHTTDTHTFAGQTITTNSPRGLAIGSMVGLAAGAAVALVLFTHSHQFYIEVGSPMQMTVPEPITLARDQVDEANRTALQQPAPPPPPAPRPVPVIYPSTPANHGTCFTPDTPGTPPTVIPGTPGPNGIPGPPTVIPGTPPTPGTPYPCP